MKKHLIAAAVAAAVAVPAAAQVTVSGSIDTALGNVNNGSTSFTGSLNNLLTTSNIRFSGSEDLGGGLKAGFTILQEFTPSDGANSDRTLVHSENDGDVVAAKRGSQIDRFSNLNVSLSGGFGTVTLGKQQALARNAGGAGSFIGNVGLTGTYNTTGTRGLGDKVNDAVAYTTPTFNGITAQVLRGSRQGSTYLAAAEAKEDAKEVLEAAQTVAVGLTYAQGPITLGAGQLKREKSATADATTRVFAGSYDLKVAKIGFVHSIYEKDDQTPAADNKLKTTVLQFSAPISGAATLIGAYHDAEAETGADNSATGLVLGATYAFSKRTTGYAIWSKVDNDANSDYSMPVGMSAVSTPGRDPKTMAIGLRHNF
jgi:general bacterial porin, GBP family